MRAEPRQRATWGCGVATHETEFVEFVDAFAPSLMRTAVGLTGSTSEADDLLQDALIDAWRYWKRVRRSDAPQLYVRKILVNAYARKVKRQARSASLVDGERPDQSPNDYEQVADRDELVRLLNQLPPRQRSVLILRYLDDLSERDTAVVLGCSVGTVKSQSSRALTTLQSLTSAASLKRQR